MLAYYKLKKCSEITNLAESRMSRKYKFKNPDGIFFIVFSTANWVNVLQEAHRKL